VVKDFFKSAEQVAGTPIETRPPALCACSAALRRNMLWCMATPAPSQNATSTSSPKLRQQVIKIAVLTLFSLALGFGYDRAAPRTYGPERVAGFFVGMMHGALMPAALPALVFGKDLPIYAQRNVGRGYNIGFILGLNACGTLFFGISFWHPKKR
jgi:hypothetical protein